ncbi:MAG: hypothetical protein AB8B97_24415 [Granulosicoccus sp.]
MTNQFQYEVNDPTRILHTNTSKNSHMNVIVIVNNKVTVTVSRTGSTLLVELAEQVGRLMLITRQRLHSLIDNDLMV